MRLNFLCVLLLLHIFMLTEERLKDNTEKSYQEKVLLSLKNQTLSLTEEVQRLRVELETTNRRLKDQNH